MAQIEKPTTSAIVEGFDELNSKCDATEFTTIRRSCDHQIKPSHSFAFTIQAEVFACSALTQSFSPKAEGGNDEY